MSKRKKKEAPQPQAIQPVAQEPSQLPVEEVAPQSSYTDPATDTVVPADPGVTEPAPATTQQKDDDFLMRVMDYGVDDLFSSPEEQELLKRLREQSQKQMPMGQQIALGFTALANPQYAKQMMDEFQGEKQSAQDALLKMHSNLVEWRRQALKEYGMEKRAEEAATARAQAAQTSVESQTNIARMRVNASRYADVRSKLDEAHITDVPPAPTFTDDASMTAWEAEVYPKLQQAAASITMRDNFLGLLEMGAVNPDTIEADFKAQAAASFLPPERADEMWAAWGSNFRTIAKNMKMDREADRRKEQAEIDRYNAMTTKLSLETQQLDKALASDDIKDLANAARVLSQWDIRLNALDQTEQRYLQEQLDVNAAAQAGTITPADLNQYSARIARNMNRLQETRDRLAQQRMDYEARIRPYQDKLNFSGQYERFFDDTLSRFLEQSPMLYANADATVAAIASPEPSDIKTQFWRSVMTRVRIEYPTLTLSDFMNLVEEHAWNMAQARQGMSAQMPEGGPVSATAEQQMWTGAGQDIERFRQQEEQAKKSAEGAGDQPIQPSEGPDSWLKRIGRATGIGE